MNPIVAETNDGYLNDSRDRRMRCSRPLATPKSPIDEESVGAGIGK
jgi:L-aminopeptidase/D-esterase-like protein